MQAKSNKPKITKTAKNITFFIIFTLCCILPNTTETGEHCLSVLTMHLMFLSVFLVLCCKCYCSCENLSNELDSILFPLQATRYHLKKLIKYKVEHITFFHYYFLLICFLPYVVFKFTCILPITKKKKNVTCLFSFIYTLLFFLFFSCSVVNARIVVCNNLSDELDSILFPLQETR